ncbi:TM2 domain-containing protein [Mycolicibacterium hodleri]|uniref:TM2 domain-containing protein n=1 Tax=Mycolicibacterium hodleri TaxID=49897 RepID=UPI003F7F77E6
MSVPPPPPPPDSNPPYPPPPYGSDPSFPPPVGDYGGYPPPPQYGAQYGGYPPPYPAQFGVDPWGRPLSDKSKMVAGLLQIFLGTFGIGRFYLGYNGIAVAQLAVSLLTCGSVRSGRSSTAFSFCSARCKTPADGHCASEVVSLSRG